MSDYEAMHWSALKKLVEAKGGEWTDKNDAIAFLSGETLPETKPSAAFDKTKTYGEIYGVVEGAPGAMYSQGGHLFNVNGVKVG